MIQDERVRRAQAVDSDTLADAMLRRAREWAHMQEWDEHELGQASVDLAEFGSIRLRKAGLAVALWQATWQWDDLFTLRGGIDGDGEPYYIVERARGPLVGGE